MWQRQHGRQDPGTWVKTMRDRCKRPKEDWQWDRLDSGCLRGWALAGVLAGNACFLRPVRTRGPRRHHQRPARSRRYKHQLGAQPEGDWEGALGDRIGAGGDGGGGGGGGSEGECCGASSFRLRESGCADLATLGLTLAWAWDDASGRWLGLRGGQREGERCLSQLTHATSSCGCGCWSFSKLRLILVALSSVAKESRQRMLKRRGVRAKRGNNNGLSGGFATLASLHAT